MPDGRECSDVAISTVDTTRNEEDEDEYTDHGANRFVWVTDGEKSIMQALADWIAHYNCSQHWLKSISGMNVCVKFCRSCCCPANSCTRSGQLRKSVGSTCVLQQ